MHIQNNLKSLREAVPYIRANRGRTFVLKLGGRMCTPGPVLDNIVDQLVSLHQLGIRIVVVHGGGAQATALSKRLGIMPEVFAGRRITDDETLEVVKMTFAGTVNTDLVAAFQKAGVSAVGLTGVDAGLICARKRPVGDFTDPATGTTREVDFGHVGDIEQVDPHPLQHLLDGGMLPIVCSLAGGPDGTVLNVNADTVAARIAIALQAAKYFLVTNVDGVLRDARDPATLQSYLALPELETLITDGVISGGMLPKLAACADALNGGVPRVHIVNGLTPDTLLGEVFTNEGCGTLLVAQRDGAAPGVAVAKSVVGQATAATPITGGKAAGPV